MQARVLGAMRMLGELKRDERVKKIVFEMDKLAKALISLAYAEIPAQNNVKGIHYDSFPLFRLRIFLCCRM